MAHGILPKMAKIFLVEKDHLERRNMIKTNQNKQLISLRKQIDAVDRKIVLAIFQRLQIAKKIGQEKSKHKLTVISSKRESEVISNICTLSSQLGIELSTIKPIFKLIIQESRKVQV
jgi:chorismate mutase